MHNEANKHLVVTAGKSLSLTHISKLSRSQLEVNHSILRLAENRFILRENL